MTSPRNTDGIVERIKTPDNQLQSHRIWDLPVRLFHWLLVVLIALLWFSGEFGGLDISTTLPLMGNVYIDNMELHSLTGQTVLLLLIFRILWGIWGSTTARISHFMHRPARIKNKLTLMLKGRIEDSTGHNPLGGLMVLILIIVLTSQVLTGLFSSDGILYDAPLTHLVSGDVIDVMTSLHHQIFGVLQILIVLHICAIIYYRLRGHNLITPMITGLRKKPVDEQLEFKSWSLAIISLVIACITLLLLRSL